MGELNDNFPRGIQVRRFDLATSVRVVPYEFKTHVLTKSNGKKWSNDNYVYTEIAHPGVVEVADGLLIFFSGERPALDNSLTNCGSWQPLCTSRNLGFVKIAKEFEYEKAEVLSKGVNETGEYWSFFGRRVSQKNVGIRYLTNYTSVQKSASRVKTAMLDEGKILLYWEVWSRGHYQYTQLMIVNDEGTPIAGPWAPDAAVALPFSDNLLAKSGGQAIGYTGHCDADSGQCHLMRYAFQYD